MPSDRLFYEQIRIRATAEPDRLFLRDECRSFSYSQTLDYIDEFATIFLSNGLTPGQRCIIFMENSLDYIVAWLALSRICVVSVPLNQSLRGPLLIQHVR